LYAQKERAFRPLSLLALSFTEFASVTSFAVFAIALPSSFRLARREQLLSANANFAFGCHGKKAKAES